MLDSIYTANSGLQSFAKGLDVISDNVTNVNTVGYKATNIVYSDVHYNYSVQDGGEEGFTGAQIGSGVSADTTSIFFNQGDLQQTDNNNDTAISGNGFFVVQKDGGLVYSRDGQFEFNSDGNLVTRNGGDLVMGLSGSGELAPINKNPFAARPAVPTSTISFTGNLAAGTGSTAGTATASPVPIFDSLGGEHDFKVTFNQDLTAVGTASWNIVVTDENGVAQGPGGVLKFSVAGAPQAGANTYSFTYQPAGGAAAQNITLNFGDPDSFSNITGFSGAATNTISVGTQDGHTKGALETITFNASGQLIATYSDQETQTGPQLALASFDDLQSLQQLGQGLFRPQAQQTVKLGTAGEGGFGSITDGSVESSNVDLSQQFTNMIVIQRGYQASSQVLTAANEMLQQLLEAGKK